MWQGVRKVLPAVSAAGCTKWEMERSGCHAQKRSLSLQEKRLSFIKEKTLDVRDYPVMMRSEVFLARDVHLSVSAFSRGDR